MKLKVIRDKIAWFVASKEGKKNLTEGVTDDNFYDFSYYVDLIAKSLRRMANERHCYFAMGWLLPEDVYELSDEEKQRLSDEETARLNKWADILEIDETDLNDADIFDPYFDALDDHLFGSKLELSEENQELGRTLNSWDKSLRNLKSDILSELGTNYFYMWD